MSSEQKRYKWLKSRRRRRPRVLAHSPAHGDLAVTPMSNPRTQHMSLSARIAQGPYAYVAVKLGTPRKPTGGDLETCASTGGGQTW